MALTKETGEGWLRKIVSASKKTGEMSVSKYDTRSGGLAIRDITANVWTAVAIGAAIVALHAWWFVRSTHKGDVISGFGVSLAVLGILVAAQPLINTGIRTTARREMGLVSQERQKELDEQAHIVEARAARRVFQEQVCAAALVAVGTLLNGYAPALARLFSLPV